MSSRHGERHERSERTAREPRDEATWRALVLAEYDRLRDRHPELAALRPAHFVFAEGLTRTLGLWDRAGRTITLDRALLSDDYWHALCHVLRHETAHQLADEGLGAAGRGEPPHGPTFRRACELLGADPSAQIDLEQLRRDATESDVARRIRKLLALAGSHNRHEAEAALAKAQQLALKYNVELAPAAPTDYAFRLVGEPRRRWPRYTWGAAALVCDHYFVRYICRGWDDRTGALGGGRFSVIEMYGRPDNLDLAEYVFTFLMQQSERAWKAYRAELDQSPPRGARLSFIEGVIEGFRSRLDRERVRLERDHALVWTGDPALERYYRARNPRVRHVRRGGAYDPDAEAAGEAVGKELRVKPALRRGTSGGPAGLLGDG